MTKIYQLYFELLKKYGQPRPWPWYVGSKPSSPLEICLGSILTQNTNWRNVEKALANLLKVKAINVEKLAKMPSGELESHLKPSGFYKQKAVRLQNFCRHLLKNYQGDLKKLFEKEFSEARKELLSLEGIGPETTDTILLYAGKKLIFVIDEYTRRFVRRHNLSQDFSYEGLQKLFMNRLPKNVKIYEDYHALIVWDEKAQR